MLRKIISKVKHKYTSIVEKQQYQKFLSCHSELKKADTIFTHLTTSEKRKLFELASKIKNGYAVEIGSFVGASACFLAAGMNHQTKLICIDTWENDAMSEGKRDTKKEFDNNTRNFESKITKIQGYSTNVLEQVKEISGQLDFLFIDGDHSYEGCKTDWDLYFPLVKSGGCIVFHDSGWAEGVKRVIEEDAKPVMKSFDSLPNMFWGYIR